MQFGVPGLILNTNGCLFSCRPEMPLPPQPPPDNNRQKRPHGVTSRPESILNYKHPGPKPPLRENNSDHLFRRDYAEANSKIARLNFNDQLLGLRTPITRHHNLPSHLKPNPPAPEDSPSVPPRQRPQSTSEDTQPSSGWAPGLDHIIGPAPNPDRNPSVIKVIKRKENIVPPRSANLPQPLSSHAVGRKEELNRIIDSAIARKRRNSFTEVQPQVGSASTSRDLTQQSSGPEVNRNIPNTDHRSRAQSQVGSVSTYRGLTSQRSGPPIDRNIPNTYDRSSTQPQVQSASTFHHLTPQSIPFEIDPNSYDRSSTQPQVQTASTFQHLTPQSIPFEIDPNSYDRSSTQPQVQSPQSIPFVIDPNIPNTRYRSSNYYQEDNQGGSRTPTNRHRLSPSVHGRNSRSSSRSSQVSRDRTPTRNDRETSGHRNRPRHRRSSSQTSFGSGERPLRAGYPSFATQQDLTGSPEGFQYNPGQPTIYKHNPGQPTTYKKNPGQPTT